MTTAKTKKGAKGRFLFFFFFLVGPKSSETEKKAGAESGRNLMEHIGSYGVIHAITT